MPIFSSTGRPSGARSVENRLTAIFSMTGLPPRPPVEVENRLPPVFYSHGHPSGAHAN
jgi:hypothetical protein